VFVVAAIAAAGSFLFARETSAAGLKRGSFVAVCFLAMFAAGHSVLVGRQESRLRLPYVKGRRVLVPLYEKWNSFSRIAVYGNPDLALSPSAWGLSTVYPADRKVRQLTMDIDASAATFLTAFDGDLAPLDHLKYDVVNIAHYVRPDSSVLVVGSGGGRDVLAALVFRQPSVTGVEINQDIIDTVNRVFGDFTGHLDRDPRVRFVADEARSWMARQRDRFGIIQISLIDTWASTAAGAFVLSENCLYTTEAWQQFLERLTPDGVLTVSRWHMAKRPLETLRLVALANAALRREGVTQPRDHMVMVTAAGKTPEGPGIGTLLVSKAPFSARDLDTLESVAARMGFKVFLSPRASADKLAAAMASAEDVGAAVADYTFNIAPTTDDSPFFFHTLRFRDLLKPESWEHGVAGPRNAVLVLPVLLLIVMGLTLVCIGVPLRLAAERPPARVALPLLVYFAAIGAGFMLVEVSQMQRLIVFLGHPTYALSVVLFSLLLFCGIGSYTTRLVRGPNASGRAALFLSGLLVVLLLFGALTPQAITAFRASPTPLRILIAVGLLSPIGLVMGTAFPIGMKAAATRSASLTPWLWGVNGATSVCASVVAVVIALGAGISASFWTGVACYIAAAAAFAWEVGRER
jgi:hypothetical protein